MMLIKLIAVGKLKDKLFLERCKEYEKRLRPYAKIEVVELPDSDSINEGKAFARELEKEKNSYIIALTEEGKTFTTEGFAKVMAQRDSKVCFLIGGPFGLAQEIRDTAHLKWSLSPLTFPHELARLLFYEQLYRVLNFNNGGSYHHI